MNEEVYIKHCTKLCASKKKEEIKPMYLSDRPDVRAKNRGRGRCTLVHDTTSKLDCLRMRHARPLFRKYFRDMVMASSTKTRAVSLAPVKQLCTRIATTNPVGGTKRQYSSNLVYDRYPTETLSLATAEDA